MSKAAGATGNEMYRKMQLILSKTLLYGVLLATAIIVVGLALLIITNSTGYKCDTAGDSLSCLLNYNPVTIPHGDYPNTLSALVSGLGALKPFAIIELGIIVLLATPAFRVLTSLVLFGIEKDKAFVWITLFVFVVLLFSFFIVPLIPIFKA